MPGEDERGVVRVKVQKCDGVLPVELRSFAVDPQITSLEVLQHILIRAFDLNGKRNFGISYLSRDHSGAEVYLSLTSDWDLDVAFVSAAKPYLELKMDIKQLEDSPVMEDWDIISPKDVISSEQLLADRTRSLASAVHPFTQSLLTQVGRTLSRVQQALSWSYGEELKPFKPPLSDAEFHSYMNSQGQLTRPEELRLRIYHGGVEASLRKVVWRYLLNVYPDGLSGQERMDYMKRKTREYDQLKREWTARVSPEDLEFIRGNVLKDVLRTDRAHPYYAGSEDSPHLTALTDLLTTFAITHPQIVIRSTENKTLEPTSPGARFTRPAFSSEGTQWCVTSRRGGSHESKGLEDVEGLTREKGEAGNKEVYCALLCFAFVSKTHLSHPEMDGNKALESSEVAKNEPRSTVNPIEHLWRDQFAKEEWSKLLGGRYKKLIDGYRKQLISVIFSKGCATEY